MDKNYYTIEDLILQQENKKITLKSEKKSGSKEIKPLRIRAKSFFLTYKFNKEINSEFIDEFKLKVLNNPRVVEFLWDYLKFEDKYYILVHLTLKKKLDTKNSNLFSVLNNIPHLWKKSSFDYREVLDLKYEHINSDNNLKESKDKQHKITSFVINVDKLIGLIRENLVEKYPKLVFLEYENFEFFQPLENFLEILQSQIKFSERIVFKNYKTDGIGVFLEVRSLPQFLSYDIAVNRITPKTTFVVEKDISEFFKIRRDCRIASINFTSIVYTERFSPLIF